MATKVLWFTGLPCSGKTTISKKLEKELKNKGYSVIHLDGDDVRRGINSDLGFSREDRKENLRRIAHIVDLLVKKTDIDFILTSFVSPEEFYRDLVKNIIGEEGFKLVYVKCPLKVCEERDVKGMYVKARNGEILEFTGVSAPFEEPKELDVVVETDKQGLEKCTSKIIKVLNL